MVETCMHLVTRLFLNTDIIKGLGTYLNFAVIYGNVYDQFSGTIG